MAIVTERFNVESRTKPDAFAVDITLDRGFESHRLPFIFNNKKGSKMFKKSLAILLILPTISHAAPSALAVAATQGVTTQILQPTDIVSVHGINLSNDSSISQLFYWTVSLCPETQPERCKIFSDHTALAPHQKWSHIYNFRSTIVFKAIGSKPITAKTEITGAASSVVYDTKYVDVHY